MVYPNNENIHSINAIISGVYEKKAEIFVLRRVILRRGKGTWKA